jgi:hypothetical protein
MEICWDHCIKTEGDYFEEDGGKFQELLGRTSYIFKGLSNMFQLFDFSFLPIMQVLSRFRYIALL